LTPAFTTGCPVAMDWETTSLNLFDGSLRPIGLAVSVAPGSARYVPVAHTSAEICNVPLVKLKQVLQRLDARISTLWYNFRFDGEVCRNAFGGWEPSRWDDVMLALQLMEPEAKQTGLKAVVARVF